MSFHPNDVQRRSRMASGFIAIAIAWLTMSFFRAQVVQKMKADSVADLVRMADRLKITPQKSAKSAP